MHELVGASQQLLDAIDNILVHIDVYLEAFKVYFVRVEAGHAAVQLANDVMHAGNIFTIILL